MIKKYLISIFISCCSMTMFAQNNHVKIAAGLGTVPYEGTFGTNVELQYEYTMKSRLSGFLSLGTNRDKFITEGRSQGSDGVEMWDNSWKFQYSEQFNYMDIGLKYVAFKLGERYTLKAVIGASLGQSVYTYPENIFINKGVIEEKVDATHKAEVGMLLAGVENKISISDRFSVSVNLLYRTTFVERHIFTREITFHNNLASSTSGILQVVNANLQFGYTF